MPTKGFENLQYNPGNPGDHTRACCAHAQKKDREDPDISPLDDLETLNKQKVKAKAELEIVRALDAHAESFGKRQMICWFKVFKKIYVQ